MGAGAAGRPAGEELAAWWRRALVGAQTLRLATDRPRPPVNDFDGREESRALPPGLLDDLRELSRREGATLFATLMAGLHALLHRYSGQDDLVVGTTSANRRRAALTPLIGFLVNTLPIRCDASGDPPFTEFLGRVREAMVGALRASGPAVRPDRGRAGRGPRRQPRPGGADHVQPGRRRGAEVPAAPAGASRSGRPGR